MCVAMCVTQVKALKLTPREVSLFRAFFEFMMKMRAYYEHNGLRVMKQSLTRGCRKIQDIGRRGKRRNTF